MDVDSAHPERVARGKEECEVTGDDRERRRLREHEKDDLDDPSDLGAGRLEDAQGISTIK